MSVKLLNSDDLALRARTLGSSWLQGAVSDADFPGFVLKTTCALSLKILFWLVWALLIIATVVDFFFKGVTWLTWVNIASAAVIPLLFRPVSHSHANFTETGIELNILLISWEAVCDVSVDEARRLVTIELDDKSTRILYARRSTTHAMYETVLEYSHQMIAMKHGPHL